MAQSINAWSKATGPVPGKFEAYLKTANKHQMVNDPDAIEKAIAATRRALIVHPDNAEALSLYIELNALRAAALLSKETRRTFDQTIKFIDEARGQAASKRVRAALALADQDHARCLSLLGDIQDLLVAECALASDPARALKLAEAIRKENQADKRAVLIQGKALARMGRYKEAITLLSKVGGKTTWQRTQGRLLISVGRKKRGVEALQRAVQSKDERAALLLAKFYLQEGESEKALPLLAPFEKSSRATAAHLAALSETLAPQDAKRALRIAQSAQGMRNAQQARIPLINAALLAGDPALAEKEAALGEKAEKDKRGALYAALSGAALTLRDQREKALRAFQRAVTLDPTDARLRIYLVTALLSAGNKADAARALSDMEGLDPDQALLDDDLLQHPKALELETLKHLNIQKQEHPDIAGIALGFMMVQAGDPKALNMIPSRAEKSTARIAKLAKIYAYLSKGTLKRSEAAALFSQKKSVMSGLLLARIQTKLGQKRAAEQTYDAVLSMTQTKLLLAQVEQVALGLDKGTTGAQALLRLHKDASSIRRLRRLLYKAGI